MMALETASPTIVLISTISSTVGFKQTTKEAIHVLTKGSFSKVALKESAISLVIFEPPLNIL